MTSSGEVDRVALPTDDIPGADLGWVLGIVLRGWHEAVDAVLEDLPHGLRGFQILAVAAHENPPTQTGLARHLHIDKTVLPYVIDDLVNAGLVERRVDPNDRRMRRIVTTDAGARLLRQRKDAVERAQADVLGGVPDAVRDAFLDASGRVALSIHSTKPYLDPCLAVLGALTGAEGDLSKR